MRAGQLRHRIAIQRQPQGGRDDWGEPIDQWETVWPDIPARIESVSGREFFAAQQVQGEVDTKITIRWRIGVLPMMRAVHQTREQAALSPAELTIYDIAAVLADDTGRRELTLMCKYRTNPGFRSGT